MDHVIATSAQIGQILVSGRRRAGLTQAEAAARAGISQSRISVLEADPGPITLIQLLALFGAYNIQMQVKDRQDATVVARKRVRRTSKVEW